MPSSPIHDLPARRNRITAAIAVVAIVLVACGAVLDESPPEPPTPPASGRVADGHIPGGGWASLDDRDLPALARLDPALLAAVRRAAADARADGVELRVTGGWRSPGYQQQLLDEAIVTYGSRREARRFVSTPELSRHVTGEAIDIGPTDAAYWLIQHGATYGLCQVYANEVWHFELLTEPGGTCPPLLTDASAD